MTILKTPIPKTILTSILNFIKSGYQKKLNTANAATGVYTATLNATDGIITYSGAVSSGEPVAYTLNSSKITANSVIFWSIEYDAGDTEQLTQLSYTRSPGQVIFWIGIYNGINSQPRVVVNFKIQN